VAEARRSEAEERRTFETELAGCPHCR
jgi:hypothetical protein